MSRIHGSVRTAALIGASAMLAACGGNEAEVIRRQGELRSKLDAQTSEVEGLRTRVKDLESRSRSLEEQVAAAGIVRSAGPSARGPATPGASEGDDAPGMDAPSSETASLQMPAFLETEEGKEQLRTFLKAEETRKEEAERQVRQQAMDNMVKERVTGYLTEQLGLTTDQQARVLDIATDSMNRIGEVWRGARGTPGGPAPDFQAMRDKTEEIRTEAMDKLSQALTVDQYNKLQEMGPGMGIMGGGRGGFGGTGGTRGGQDGGPGGAGGGGRGGR